MRQINRAILRRKVRTIRRIAPSPRPAYHAGLVSDGGLGFDYGAILSAVGSAASGAVSWVGTQAGALITGLAKPAAMAALVTAIAGKQLAAKPAPVVMQQAAAPAPAPPQVIMTGGGGGGGSFYPTPINISAGGAPSAYPYPTAVGEAPSWIPGVPNLYLLAGAGLLAVVLVSRR